MIIRNPNNFALCDKLKEKTKRGVSKTYLEIGMFPSGEPYTSAIDDYLKGVLSYNDSDSQTPLVIIDGRPYT